MRAGHCLEQAELKEVAHRHDQQDADENRRGYEQCESGQEAQWIPYRRAGTDRDVKEDTWPASESHAGSLSADGGGSGMFSLRRFDVRTPCIENWPPRV